MIRRREFITLLGGAAAAWPLAARAQQPSDAGDRRAHARGENDAQARLALTLRQGLERIGLERGPQLTDRIPLGRGRCRLFADTATELLALAPDVIVANPASPSAPAAGGDRGNADRVRAAIDPVGAGFVDSLARPGGNATGFTIFELCLGAKWLELLKGDRAEFDAIAACAINPAPELASLPQFRRRGRSGSDLSVIDLNDANASRARLIAEFAQGSNGGLILT